MFRKIMFLFVACAVGTMAQAQGQVATAGDKVVKRITFDREQVTLIYEDNTQEPAAITEAEVVMDFYGTADETENNSGNEPGRLTLPLTRTEVSGEEVPGSFTYEDGGEREIQR